MTYTHLRDLFIFVASLVTYNRLGGILLLSQLLLLLLLLLFYLHPVKESYHFYDFVSNLHLSMQNLVT